MRLHRFSLQHYGPFEATDLALDPSPGVVNLILAPNGAGKSVIRLAFRDLIFGIAGRSPMSFRYGYKAMRLLAEVAEADGNRRSIGRRKGQGNTLIDGEGATLDPGTLTALIGRADETLFDRLFALDSHLLRSGGEALIDSKGDFGAALFAAGGGTAQIRHIRERFEAARDSQAPAGRRAATRPLYQALDRFAQAERDLRADQVRPEAFERIEQAIKNNQQKRADLVRQQTLLTDEANRLQRLKALRPFVDRLGLARQDAAASADSPQLPPNTGIAWAKARQALDQAGDSLATQDADLAALYQRRDAMPRDQVALDQAERIEALTRALGSVDADHRDLPKREAEARLVAERLTGALVELAHPPDAPLPTTPTLAGIRALIRRHETVQLALVQARQAAAKVERELGEARATLDASPDAGDAAALAEAVGAARHDGDPGRLLGDARQRLIQATTRAHQALAQVPLWTGTGDGLIALVPPTPDLLRRVAGAAQDAAGARDEAGRRLDQAEHEAGMIARQIAVTRQGDALPEPAVVQAARTLRDDYWHLIRQIKFAGEPPPTSLADLGGDIGLATAFDRSLADSDRLADQRDGESTRLARLAQQESELAAKALDIEVLRRTATERSARSDTAAGAWTALTGRLGLGPDVTLGDVQDFLTARERVIETTGEQARMADALNHEEARQAELAQRLAQALGVIPGQPLAALLATADNRLKILTEAKRARDRVMAEVEALARQARATAQGVAETETAEAAWAADWQAGLVALGRPAGEAPAATEKALELFVQARADQAEAGSLRHRIDGMRQNIRAFEDQAKALAALAASTLDPAAPEALVQELRRRLTTARQQATAFDEMARQVKTAETNRDKVRQRRTAAAAEVAGLRRLIGAAADEDVPARLDAAKRRQDAEDALAQASAALDEHGAGRSYAQLMGELDALSPDALDARLVDLTVEGEALSKAREAAAQEDTRLEQELAAISRPGTVLDAAERRQAAAASLCRIAEEALCHHAAACLLAEALDRLRRLDDTDSLLTRIGAVFARLTGQTYQGVAADEDEDGTPFLVAVEADGTTRKTVAELSEGTRDQLFLSLRLVKVEDYARDAAPLPFIADDILQTFDDERSRYTLEALIALSHHVQVIVLTHHAHVAAMARAIGPTINVVDL